MERNREWGADIWKKVVSILQQDSKYNNESNKRVLIIRLISLTMCVYFIFLIILFLSIEQYGFAMISFFSGGGYGVVLGLTYHNRSLVAYWFQNVVTVIWMTFFVVFLGWDCGVQHFIFVLVVLICFATFDRFAVKVGYITLLCILRIALYFYCRIATPVLDITNILSVEFQIINTITIFVCIAIISLIVSNFSQEAEKKLVLYNKKLEKMANIDELTGLLNRRSMIAYIESYHDMKRECTDTIAMGDIDFFKKINDEYGHECGDVVLRELSALFEKAMEGRGKVARWGGEEFLFVFEQINGDDALIYLWEILQKIRSTKFVYAEKEIHITMTFGIEEYNGVNYEESIKKADDKLYMGKTKGRNQIVY